jgi:hypothetical protein
MTTTPRTAKVSVNLAIEVDAATWTSCPNGCGTSVAILDGFLGRNGVLFEHAKSPQHPDHIRLHRCTAEKK